jgi:hypothetical protein
MLQYIVKMIKRVAMLAVAGALGIAAASLTIVLPNAILHEWGVLAFNLNEESTLLWIVLGAAGAWGMAHMLDSIVEVTNKPPRDAEHEHNRVLMRATLPAWRRIGGFVVVVFGGSWVWVFLLSTRPRSGWVYAGLIPLSVISLMASYLLAEWLWKPFREAQRRERESLRKGSGEERDDDRRRGPSQEH